MAFITPFEASEEITSGTATPWRLLPERTPEDYMDELETTLGPNPTGTGRVEYTSAPVDDVKADNLNPGTIATIMAIPWPSGDVSVITNDVANPPPTAYRIVRASGDLVFTARGV